MFDKVTYFASLALFLVCTFLCIAIFFLKDSNEKLKNINLELTGKIESQNNSINELVKEQKRKEIQIKKSEEVAQKLRSASDRAAKKMLSQKIPMKCDQAIEWGALQGHVICEHWFA